MSGPRTTLEQMSLLHDRLAKPVYAGYMDFFQVTSDQKAKHDIVITDPATRKPSGWHFCQRERKRIELAEAYFVSKDMASLVSWAAQGLDESDTFRQDLWPTEFGFVWFDDAILGVEARGRKITLKAMTWGRIVQGKNVGTYVVTYSDCEDPRDEVSVQIMADEASKIVEQTGRLQVSHMTFIKDGSGVGPAIINPLENRSQYDNFSALYGPFAALELTDKSSNPRREILALLMLLNQTVTRVEREPVDRMTAKRMRRMNLPSEVTVVTLRRAETSRKDDESLVEWHHRWITRGHWRWQPHGRPGDSDIPHDHEMGEVFFEDGRLVRLCLTAGCDRHWERIYIAPFVKGPSDAPFKVSTKVYSLSR